MAVRATLADSIGTRPQSLQVQVQEQEREQARVLVLPVLGDIAAPPGRHLVVLCGPEAADQVELLLQQQARLVSSSETGEDSFKMCSPMAGRDTCI